MNVVIEGASKKGYFLTIGDDAVSHRWAVTEDELRELHRQLSKMFARDNEGMVY